MPFPRDAESGAKIFLGGRNFFFILWTFHVYCPYLSNTTSLGPPPQLTILFYFYFLSLIISSIASHIHAGVQLFIEVWTSYQWPHRQRRVTLSSLTAIGCQELLQQGKTSIIRARILTGLLLDRSCVVSHSFCEVVCVAARSCLEVSISRLSGQSACYEIL